MRRNLYYMLNSRLRLILRRLTYLPADLIDRIRGKRSKLIPDKGLIYTGRGNYIEDGTTNAIQLLIDEGVPQLGYRKNRLSPHYNSIGVSIQAHKKYRFNCVMDFGKLNH